jgi:hypothetical protein
VRRLVLRALPLVMAALLLSGCVLNGLVPLPADVVYPSIEPVVDAEPMPPVPLAWQFEGAEVRLSVPVDAAVYQGAKTAQKSALFFKEIDELEWIPAYYRAFVDEPSQEPLFELMIRDLRGLRDSLGLDSDRYAELIVSAVQSLDYRTDPVYLEPKFPVETVGDVNGDCDDKTLLAAALLAREGYDVAILLFEDEQHVALGIRTNGSTFGGSGYALVETTTPTLFGWVPDRLNGGIILESEPMVIPIGEGRGTYGAGRQVDGVREEYERAIATAEQLDPDIKQSQTDLDRMASEVEQVRAGAESRSAQGDVAGFNTLVPRYNELVAAYNAAVETHNALVARQQQAVEIATRISENQTDRYGLAEWLGIGL